MAIYALKRLGVAILVALTVSVLAFLLLHLSGDPALALAGEGARQADIDLIRKTYGLDRPIIVQYADWLWHILQGDFGTSVYFKTEAGPLILSKLATTLKGHAREVRAASMARIGCYISEFRCSSRGPGSPRADIWV